MAKILAVSEQNMFASIQYCNGACSFTIFTITLK